MYLDMDDVLADFYSSAKDENGIVQEERMFDKNFFLNLEPTKGSKRAVYILEKMGFDLWVLSQPFTPVPESYMEKALWIQRHFPLLTNKLILTQDKGLHVGDYLIDDNYKKWENKFKGKFVHFQYGGYNLPNSINPEWLWEEILETLKQNKI
jgi:5'(3')-deoxyribonucleotidase